MCDGRYGLKEDENVRGDTSRDFLLRIPSEWSEMVKRFRNLGYCSIDLEELEGICAVFSSNCSRKLDEKRSIWSMIRVTESGSNERIWNIYR